MATKRASGAVVGLGITEAAATIAFLRDDGPCTFAGLETAAARCTVCVRLAGTGDELGSIAKGENEYWMSECS